MSPPRGGDQAIEQMSNEEFERQLMILMRRNPRVLETFLRRYARIHGALPR